MSLHACGLKHCIELLRETLVFRTRNVIGVTAFVQHWSHEWFGSWSWLFHKCPGLYTRAMSAGMIALASFDICKLLDKP